MPEFPEVFTTVKGLQENILGLKISDVWQGIFSTHKLFTKTIKNKDYYISFRDIVLTSKVKSVSQRAKNILINLDNNYTIVIHLKMTGHLLVGKWDAVCEENLSELKWIPQDKNSSLNDKYNRHIRTVFTFSNGYQMAFCDSRKFGTVEIFNNENLKNKFLKLGPTPFDISLKKFKEILLTSNREIKTVLMDQSKVSGVGNIYSDEALFRAHILPTRKPKSLNEKEWDFLFKFVQEVLNSGIDFGGDSMSDYRNVKGEKGGFQNKHLVYLRDKEKCKNKNCTGEIKKKKIGGRSAHYCDFCQF